jgi:hypothetical protein
MKRHALLVLWAALSSTACVAADRAIDVPAKTAMAWGYLTPNSTLVKPSRTLGVGFWQRGSGAKPGVGEVFVSAMEYQLPEAAPVRLRSATFQFSGKPSQCVGNEPVVVDVYAYSGDGKSDVGDATAGTKVAQLSANCTDHAAFARPIDVTHIVRQTTTAAGLRFVGFNVRKANNRQGPGLFNLSAGKLTVVIADQDIAKPALSAKPAQGTNPAQGTTPTTGRFGALGGAPTTAAPPPTPRKATASAAPTAVRNQAQR